MLAVPVQETRDQRRFALSPLLFDRPFMMLLLLLPLPAGFTAFAKAFRG
jgi:hypothetical protein